MQKRARSLTPWVGTTAVVLAAAACGGTTEHRLVGTARAPGADGIVQVERIEGGNHLVTVVVSNLLPPQRLGSGLRSYVVWFETDGAGSAKAGVLRYDEGHRQGDMFATYPQRAFRLKITAERSGDVASPSDIVVISHRIDSR